MNLYDVYKAANDGHAAHQVYLARLHLMGSGVPRDIDAALDWLGKATAQNHAASYAERAAIHAQGYSGKIDHAAAWRDIQMAAHLGDLSAVCQVGVLALAAGDEAVGEALLHHAAKAGDEPAQILLAELLWARKDADAAYWYARARNNPMASWRMRIYELDAPKTKPKPSPEVTADVWDRVRATDPFNVQPAAREDLHDVPEIYTLREAMPRWLCRYVMAVGAGQIRESDVVDPDTGKSKKDSYRTGFHHQFMSGLCDFTVALFDHHIAAQTRTRATQGEPLTLLVYRPGQQYRAHWDHLVDTMDESFGRLGRSGNRLYTALVTLDDAFKGGATRFTRLGIDVRLNPGDMLVFKNLDDAGQRLDDTMHAGMPVEEGVKWLASKWIRQKDYAH